MNEVLYYVVRNRTQHMAVVEWDGLHCEIEGGPSGRPQCRFSSLKEAIQACLAANDTRPYWWESRFEVFGVTKGGLKKV